MQFNSLLKNLLKLVIFFSCVKGLFIFSFFQGLGWLVRRTVFCQGPRSCRSWPTWPCGWRCREKSQLANLPWQPEKKTDFCMNSIFLDTINVMELMLDRTTSIACLSLSSVCLVKSSKELGFLLLYVHSRGKWFFPPLFYQGSPLSLSLTFTCPPYFWAAWVDTS